MFSNIWSILKILLHLNCRYPSSLFAESECREEEVSGDPTQLKLMPLGVSSLLQWEYDSTLLEYNFLLVGIISMACLSCFECKGIRCV